MKKYWTFFKVSFANSFEYRGALFVWVLVEFVSICSSLFIWSGIFKSNSTVGNFQLNDMLVYYFMLPIISSVTAVYVSENLPRDIKDGQISSQIIKPYNFSLFKLTDTFATKITRIMVKLPIYIIFGIYFWSNLNFAIRFDSVIFVLFFSLLAYLMHYYLDFSLSLLAFWIEDTWSFSLLKRVMLLIFGGLAFPLSLVPSNFRWIFDLLPFKFIYYIPSAMLQGKLSHQEITSNLIQLLFYILIFMIIGNSLWRKGIKKYGAYGQ